MNKIYELQEQIAQENRLNYKLKSLKKQQEELEKKVSDLRWKKEQENEDVERLEGRSLYRFFYKIMGKESEKMEQEQREAYEAAVKYDAAVQELNAVRGDISQIKDELMELRDCQQRYEAAVQQKKEELKASGSVQGQEIAQMEQEMIHLQKQIKEVEEAIAAGRRAQGLADSILEDLSSAESWGTWDLLGGGLISDMAKHSHLDNAQGKIESLQVELRRFKTELSDVKIQSDLNVQIEGFLHFADYFFDGIFADWTVLEKIKDSRAKVQDVKGQVGQMLKNLDVMK
ncbi:MAG: hypothetical protein IJ315_06550, partial [Firmicutes bacterium]|nr:hypothetical protein [Bacillota bacterium]